MNPYTQGNPFTSQVADIGYPQVDYQTQPQNTSLQDQYHAAMLQQMQQMGSQQPNYTNVTNPLAMAMMLRKSAPDSGLTPKQTWDMTYGTQASPYTGGATFGVDAAQNYDYWK